MAAQARPDMRSFSGQACIDGYEAYVLLTTDTAADSKQASWSGTALLREPPSFHLLEFAGTAALECDVFGVSVEIVDATPGTGVLYLHGEGRAPWLQIPPGSTTPRASARPRDSRTKRPPV